MNPVVRIQEQEIIINLIAELKIGWDKILRTEVGSNFVREEERKSSFCFINRDDSSQGRKK